MNQDTTMIFTTGIPGSGKSYVRCARYVPYFLRSRSGSHWSNFPLGRIPQNFKGTKPVPGETFRRRIAEYCERIDKIQLGKVFGWFTRLLYRIQGKKAVRPAAEYAKRIRIIPERELLKWQVGDSGPWEFFRGVDLAHCHIAIDECHLYVGTEVPRMIRAKWKRWLSELRHDGLTVEFLTQVEAELDERMMKRAGNKYELSQGELQTDPVFKIPMGHWWNLKAGLFTRIYERAFLQSTWRMQGKKWARVSNKWVKVDPMYYDFYNTFSKPQYRDDGEAEGSDGGEPKEFEKRTRLGIVWWFFWSHPLAITKNFAIGALLLWVLGFGGGGVLFGFIQNSIKFGPKSTEAQAAAEDETKEQATPPAPVVPVVDTRELPGVVFHRSQRPNPTPLNMTDPDIQVVTDPAHQVDPQRHHIEEQKKKLLAAQESAAKLRLELAEVQSEREKLERRIKRGSAVVLLTPERATFRDSYEYRVGETIDVGEYAGRTLEVINYARRSVHLDDGTILRLGRPDDVGVSNARPPDDDQPGRDLP